MNKTSFLFHQLSPKKRAKLSDLVFDIVKYVITAELVAFLFSDMNVWAWYNYIIAILAIIALLLLDFGLMDDTLES